MEAIAKHDFRATQEDELSFPKNAILKVFILFVFTFNAVYSSMVGLFVVKSNIIA